MEKRNGYIQRHLFWQVSFKNDLDWFEVDCLFYQVVF